MYCDNCQTLLATRNATRKVSPFQNIPLLFYPYYALQPAIQFHLPNTLSLNTCATVIIHTDELSDDELRILVTNVL
jgi:hypothetical protein